MPLGRGRGATATAAPAEAATRLATAEAEQLRHTVNEAVFQTTLSYINLLAAQETVQLLDASVARHQQLVTLTRARVNGGDFAPLELDRVQARAASTEAAAAQARTSLREARLALADTVGLGVTSLTAAPTAVGTLATTVAPAGRIAELQQQAATSRRDLRALDEQQEAARVLAAGARANARTRIDLSVSAGYSNLYESPFFKYLPDEAASIIDQTQPVPIASLTGTPVPPQSPVHYYSARGFGRALTGRHEPFAMIGLTVELPFGNHAAKGRAAQAEATLQSSTISAADLVRTTDLNVADVTDALRHATDSVAAWTSTTAASTEALTGTMQRFQSGDATLIDTLLTEESLTNDELMLIEQRQVQLSVLARLRYETGTLVTFDGAGTPGELIRFLPDDFVAP